MELLKKYRELAQAVTREEFVQAESGHFLLKRPSKRATESQAPGRISYSTALLKFDVDPFATEWRIVPVKKRAGNPFPERLTVGRATNCDIVLRVPFVSKVHAHFVRQPDGAFILHDNKPSNPTYYNHRKMAPGASRLIAIGDAVGFGSLEFEFVDAARLYDILRAEFR